MNRDEIRQLLPLYIEGELEPSLMEEVKGVLSQDFELQKEASALQQSWEMLDEWEGIEPKANYVSRFWTRLSSEESWLDKFKRVMDMKRLVPTLATACIVILVAAVVLQQYQPQPVVEQELAQLSSDDLELLENLELIEDIEFLEEIEFIEEFGKVKVSKHV